MGYVIRITLALAATWSLCCLRTAAQSYEDALIGLWYGSAELASPLQGTLTVERLGQTWRASIAGHSEALHVRGSQMRFAFSGGAGEFRGSLRHDGRIEGFWIQPASSADSPYASPLVLDAAGRDRWRATVRPLRARFTLFLKIFESDGRLVAAFRNPQANSNGGATQFRVTHNGTQVALRGGPAAAPDKVTIAADLLSSPARLRMFWKDVNATIDLHHATTAEAAGFYPRPPSEPAYVYRRPPDIGDGWTTARARDIGIDEDALTRAVRNIAAADPAAARPQLVQSLLVAYRGKLVLDEYFYGFTRGEPHDLRSAGKTFASVMLGAVMMRNRALTPESKIYDVMHGAGPFANPDRRKADITLANLMTHTSGLACDDNDDDSPGNEDTMQSQTAQPNWWKYTLDLPMVHNPGERYAYCSAGMNLVGGALTTATGTWLPAVFNRTVAQPLQFGRFYWNLMPTYEGYLGGGSYLLPRDFLKLGQAYLDGGMWSGKRIVEAAWVAESTKPRVPISEATTGLSAEQFSQFYVASAGDAYAWHSNDLRSGERVFHAYQATGNGGQLLVVVPAVQLAVVITAGNYRQGGIWNRYPQQIVGDEIIPAISCAAANRC